MNFEKVRKLVIETSMSVGGLIYGFCIMYIGGMLLSAFSYRDYSSIHADINAFCWTVTVLLVGSLVAIHLLITKTGKLQKHIEWLERDSK